MSIKSSALEFPAGATLAKGFLAEPAEGGPFPALLVLQEFWGVNEHIKDVTRRVAEEGFVALAPDMYDGKVTSDANEARQLLMSLNQVAALAKLNGAVEFLKSNPRVFANKIGVIGFCMGGHLALNLACNNKDVRATAAFYGRIPPDTVLAGLNAPVLYVFGLQDHHLPVADVDRLEQFLKDTDTPGKVLRYPDADHAFMNDTRKEVYRPDDAKDAWGKAMAFLTENLAVV